MAIQIRRGTNSEWESNKSNIVAGEPAVTLDSERMFVGTGSGTYMELANLDVLADAFDPSASYEVGDFVAYHGKVYKCNTDHSGAWNASDFDEVALADALDSLGKDVYTKAEADDLLALKADASDVNSALALKADKSDTYTKTEVNTALALKADKSDTYTKTETYTKAQVDSMIQEAVEEAVKESEYSNFEMKSVSGDFIHITDGAGLIPVKDLKIGIDAVQDLHGYDAPWVGGAGKNKINSTIASSKTESGVTFTVNSDGTINVNGTAEANVLFTYNATLPAGTYILNGCPPDGAWAKWGLMVYKADAVNESDYGNGSPSFTLSEKQTVQIRIRVATGTVCSNLLFKPMIRLASVADDSFAPYTNICPIEGWTGAKVSVNGVNQWDEEWEVGSFSTSTGGKSSSNDYIRNKNLIRIFPNTQYFSQFSNGTMNLVLFYDAEQNYLGYDYVIGVANPSVFTTPSNAYYMNFRMSSTYGTTYNHDISINYPSTETDYHAYDGHVYEVTWEDEAGTVYGGTLDVTTGELVVTHKSKTFDGSNDEQWYKYSSGSASAYAMRVYENDVKFRNGIINYYANYLRSVGSNDTWGNYDAFISMITDNNVLYTGIRTITTVEDWRTYLASNNLQVVCELVTPISYTIDPTEVLTLLGENNIFADTGAVEELIYRISNQ